MTLCEDAATDNRQIGVAMKTSFMTVDELFRCRPRLYRSLLRPTFQGRCPLQCLEKWKPFKTLLLKHRFILQGTFPKEIYDKVRDGGCKSRLTLNAICRSGLLTTGNLYETWLNEPHPPPPLRGHPSYAPLMSEQTGQNLQSPMEGDGSWVIVRQSSSQTWTTHSWRLLNKCSSS